MNRHLKRLEQGKALGPTTDQDLFAYRTNIEIKRFPLPQIYKVEFGDFPGEDSKDFSAKYGEWLHTTPFFKWANDADAYVFVIDLGMYFKKIENRKTYVAEISAALRAAWQHILEHNSDAEKKVHHRPIVLAFTKADLVSIVFNHKNIKEPEVIDSISTEIIKLGFGENVPEIHPINEQSYREGVKTVEADFSDLLEYFKRETKKFHTIFVSSFGTLKGIRLGFSELLRYVLPLSF